MTTAERVLKMGMVGGGIGAFIGAVHRTAAMLDGGVRLVAGCLSSTPDRALESGRALGLDPRRNYPTWEKLIEGELALPPEERVDFISIVTPNHVHFPVALACVRAGINVVCDKPLVHTSEQASQLISEVRSSGVVFAVTYNYSGYPLVKEARDLVARGELGRVRKVIVEYNQGWLASRLEASGQKQADWRTDPARSGAGGAIGDIGSHAEHLAAYVTGLELTDICADLTTFVEGRHLDDDANLLLRFSGGARGVLVASQIEIGHENDLRLRVFGDAASLDWRQEEPNALILRPQGQPERVLRRGNDYLGQAAKDASRLPSGHPEAFFEAFANVYRNACRAIRAGVGGLDAPSAFDFPGVMEGARGVHFIEKTVQSARSDRKWTDARFSPAH
ncbi:MAG: Gfo/Idh/MocA family oxidoreductase [Phycisphaeraceae bacterium]|nr:Gfo/Idh/MocA family oxidoreductase [Phycisphaeraceae bacterium]